MPNLRKAMKRSCFQKRQLILYGKLHEFQFFFQGMMYLVTLVYGGYLIAQGEMQTADLAMYALHIESFFISPNSDPGGTCGNDAEGSFWFPLFLDVMETESEIRDADNAAELTDVKGHVRYDHVFHYNDDETPVLSDISIDIPAGNPLPWCDLPEAETTICLSRPDFGDVTGGSITVDGAISAG